MVKKSNTFSEILGYDNKDLLTISLFSREQDVCVGIKTIFNDLFAQQPKLRVQKKDIFEWLMLVDAFSMSIKYEVTPYTAEEIKKCVEQWDKEGKIDIEIPPNKAIKKRITNDRKFSFNETFGE